mgnify:CR=1 FL=1
MLGMSIIVKTNEDLQESYRDICNGDIKLTFTCIVIGTFGDVGSIIKLILIPYLMVGLDLKRVELNTKIMLKLKVQVQVQF